MKKLFQVIFLCSFLAPIALQAQSCVGTASFSVTINPSPTATINNGATAQYCSGGGVYLTAAQSTGNTYQWRLNGTPISGATSWSYLATSAGNYSVEVTNAGGCAIVSGNTAVSATATSCETLVQARLFLEGPFNSSTSLMNTNLRTANLLPRLHPFGVAPWNYNGSESVPQISNIPTNAVDWVLVELRNAANTLIASRAGFLLNDGTLRDIDGSTGFRFANTASGSYYVLVRARNHVALISANAVSLPNASTLDFSNPSNVMGGAAQVKALSASLNGLKAGDVNANGVVTVSDFNTLQPQLSSINQYLNGDMNMDGQTITQDFNLYQGNASSIGVTQVRY
jgi:hypothetical protein